MAWAEKLPSGRYRGVYRDLQGRKRSAGTFSHKPAATRAAAAVEARARKSGWADPDAGKRPWGQWADEWWPTRGVAPSTAKVDASRRKVHLDPRWAAVPIGSIRRHDIRSWAASMARRGVGPSTVQRAVHLLSASLAAAMDAEVLTANPAARLTLPHGAVAQERYLTHPEYEQLLGQMPTTDDQLVMHLLTYTGLRWGEMAGLHWDRVDLERGTLRVAETWDEKDGSITPYPKGKRIRDVPIPGFLVELLEERPRAKTCGQTHVSGRCRSGLVLTTAGGAVLRNPKWSAIWRDSVERADIGDVRIHDLRHTYASWLIQGGTPLARVGQLMGHVAPATTARYSHLGDIGPLAAPQTAPRWHNLRMVKQLLAFTAVLLFAVCVLLPHAHATAPVAASRSVLSFEWTHQLAKRFPDCQAYVQGVAAGFVVERLDGSVQRMAFDNAWHRTHDHRAEDDVWVLGQCR